VFHPIQPFTVGLALAGDRKYVRWNSRCRLVAQHKRPSVLLHFECKVGAISTPGGRQSAPSGDTQRADS